MPPYGSCLLGSVNLTKFVINPFKKSAKFDTEKFKEVVRIFTRLLDNVVEFNALPLDGQKEAIETKRRHGMGITGLGSLFNLLGMKYGSEESIALTYEINKILAVEGYKESLELAKEKGAAPLLQDQDNLNKWLDSKYMQRVFKEWPEGKEQMRKHGSRFTHHSSIAPTGTISLSFGNNISNGVEPSFSHEYVRNVIVEGKQSKSAERVFSYEGLLWREMFGGEPFPEWFVTSDDIDPKAHVDIQAAAQYWGDSSISKTVNVPTDYPFEDFKDVYMYAYDKGLKGCTTFRFNPEAFQGVLVKDSDLAATEYKFVLEDGSEHIVKGNQVIQYQGEEHTAANLYDALKEGYFGRF